MDLRIFLRFFKMYWELDIVDIGRYLIWYIGRYLIDCFLQITGRTMMYQNIFTNLIVIHTSK